MEDDKLLLIMDSMKVRLQFEKALLNHRYFFKRPEYDENEKWEREFSKKIK